MTNDKSKNFGLIGAAGYVAPRHMKAIRDTDNKLVAALDPNDSVGVLDSYSFDVSFFTEFERFDRHAEKLRRMGDEYRLHYVSIVSPNYLHDSHCRFALRIGADAICEKPLVLNPWNVDALQELEIETGQRIYSVLQLRLHPSIQELKRQVDQSPLEKRFEVDLTYITSRGPWYFTSWKGDVHKSGGVATNIGVHFFDALLWIFGSVQESRVLVSEDKRAKGHLELERASVSWHLSVDQSELPEAATLAGMRTWRSLTLDGERFEFSDGFNDLHTAIYSDILQGGGFSLNDTRAAIELVQQIRTK
jgi:UDP-N-acetyl-2-amino-2-deoxyglucuronate dehydrogenase